jgi:PKD repeat protein
MKLKPYFILLLCLVFTQTTFAITYFVTNNGDGGAGSLRQAMIDANGNAGMDEINFDIADTSVSGRTIVLLSALPAITDPVVIDAITQTSGHAFGISFAKIQVYTAAAIANCFEVESDSCSFYGFFIHDFENGIVIKNAYAKIGAIEKGNVIYNCSATAITVQGTDHVAIQGNVIGLDTAENMIAGTTGDGIYITGSFAISIGGKTFLAFNIISGNSNGIHLDNVTFVDLNSNLIGTDISGLEGRPNQYGILGTGLNVNVEVGGDSLFERNVISANVLSGIYGNFAGSVFQGNAIGLNVLGTAALGNGGEGIFLALGSIDNLIGGSDLFKPNSIAYNGLQGIVLQNATCTGNTITHNRMFCNGNGGGITLNFGNSDLTAPQLLIANGAGVAGIAEPLGTIELFKDDNCTFCEGKEFIATLTATSNGTFTYLGALSGKITATVTDTAGNTSRFATCFDTTSQTCLISGFTYTSPLCQNLDVTFIDQSVSAPPETVTAWQWDFGDGNSSTVQSPLHSFSAAGTYTVQLITTNSSSCSDTATQSVVVSEAPVAMFSTSQDACLNQLLPFSDLSTAGTGATITSWFWDFGDGTTSAIQNPSHSYVTIGSFTVNFTVTNSFGCSNTTVGTITVLPQPVASFVFTEAGLQVSFDNTSSSNGAHSSSWSFGDGGNEHR